jgi:short-subunit dehydrogenase
MDKKPDIRNAVIIGGTSGIGLELARLLCGRQCRVVITGRRRELFTQLRQDLGPTCLPRYMDVSNDEEARQSLSDIIRELGDVDLVVISAGVGFIDHKHTWQNEKTTLDVNVTGFAAIANAAFAYFLERGSGHLVGISSIAGIRGTDVPAYSASKAFVTNYLQGLRRIATKRHSSVIITDVMPGFVDTDLVRGQKMFWVAPAPKAARQILNAIDHGRRLVYTTRRWRLIAWLIKLLPDFIYNRV